MSWLRSSRFVVASALVHVAVAAYVLTRPKPPPPRRQVIEFELPQKKAPPPAPVAAVQQPERPRPVEEPRPTVKRTVPQPHPAHPQAEREPTAQPPPEQHTENTPPPQQPPPPAQPTRRPNLFDSGAISRSLSPSGTIAVTPSAPDRGTTRSAARGDHDPNLRDGSNDKEEAANNVGEMLAEAGSEERLKSGNVPPRLYDVARSIEKQFHPPESTVTDDNAISGFLHSWMNSHPGASGPAPRAQDESRSAFNGMGGAGAGATMEHGEVGRTQTVVEVVIAPDGTIVSAKIVRKSGRRKFDEQALALVKKECAKGGTLGEKTAMVTRWSVAAWLDVTPPAPGLGLGFDESTGKVSANYPMKKSVKTFVKLIGYYAKR